MMIRSLTKRMPLTMAMVVMIVKSPVVLFPLMLFYRQSYSCWCCIAFDLVLTTLSTLSITQKKSISHSPCTCINKNVVVNMITHLFRLFDCMLLMPIGKCQWKSLCNLYESESSNGLGFVIYLVVLQCYLCSLLSLWHLTTSSPDGYFVICRLSYCVFFL